jgi:hypothetical protein
MAPVLKTGIPGRVSGVRIPHSPPLRQGPDKSRRLRMQYQPPAKDAAHEVAKVYQSPLRKALP